MVNPVWHHNFSRASVAEMGLLAQARCLFHTLSNFAGVAEAWRGERCSACRISRAHTLAPPSVSIDVSLASVHSLRVILTWPSTEPLPRVSVVPPALLSQFKGLVVDWHRGQVKPASRRGGGTSRCRRPFGEISGGGRAISTSAAWPHL